MRTSFTGVMRQQHGLCDSGASLVPEYGIALGEERRETKLVSLRKGA